MTTRTTTALVTARIVLAFLGFSALVTEVATLTARDRFVAGNFFSYFTVEANTLAILSLALGAFATATGHTSRALDLYRGAVAFFMFTVLVIFVVLLSGYSSADLTAVPWDNTVLHYVMPVVVLLDWLLDCGSRASAIRPRAGLTWLVVPLAYLVYSLVRGAVVDWYPYPFMDPGEHGYVGVAVTSVVIAVVLALMAVGVASVPQVRHRSQVS